MKYKVGDMVRVINNTCCHHAKIGDIITLTDNKVKLPGSNWHFKEAVGYIAENDIEPIMLTAQPKILITTDGTKTLSRLYEGNEVVKSAEAKCSPDDTFNFNTGAQLAFNRLVYGTDYHPAEVALRKPVEKPEAVKLYGVKDYGSWITKGKVYEYADGDVRCDNGSHYKGYYHSYEDFCDHNKNISSCLVPLVSRPAKVGEWVYVVKSGEHACDCEPEIGKIYEVIKTDASCVPTKISNGAWIEKWEYFVLDGYQPEPETPKYYSGKVVCVEKGYKASIPLPDFTPGKIYEVKDGVITDDTGWHSNPIFKGIEGLCVSLGNMFIEYKE